MISKEEPEDIKEFLSVRAHELGEIIRPKTEVYVTAAEVILERIEPTHETRFSKCPKCGKHGLYTSKAKDVEGKQFCKSCTPRNPVKQTSSTKETVGLLNRLASLFKF